MASTSAARPVSHLPSPPSSASPVADHFTLSQRRPQVASHYRPFSIVSSSSNDDSCPPLQRKPRPLSLARPFSSSNLSALATMGFNFKDIGGGRDKEHSRLRKVSDSHKARPSPLARTTSSTSVALDRPSSSSGGRFINKIKKKKSFVSLFTDVTSNPPGPVPPPSGSPNPLVEEQEEPAPHTKPEQRDEEDDYEVTDRFVRKNIWIKRNSMKLHPYPSEAPYMQAYDPILLEKCVIFCIGGAHYSSPPSDRQTDMLLRRLNPSGSPSFHDYGQIPPSKILDLGCGQGHWILEAATAWPQSHVTGLDLVNVSLPSCENVENLQFVRGNFLKFQLPFQDNSFDLVRMANLTLCIPYGKWNFVLSEVQRVLTIGGRLELIDDQIFFPYGPPPDTFASTSSSGAAAATIVPGSSYLDLDDDEDDYEGSTEGEDNDEASLNTVSTLISDGNTSSSSLSYEKLKQTLIAQIDETASQLPSPPLSSSIQLSLDDPETPTLADSALSPRSSSWEDRVSMSRDVEKVFEDMLNQKFGIHPRPSEFLLDTMNVVFGNGNATKMKSMHLKLAPRDEYVSVPVSGGPGTELETDPAIPGGRKPWITIEWEKKGHKLDRRSKPDSSEHLVEEPIVTSTHIPERISPKAAGRLGISYTTIVESPSKPNRSRPASISSIISRPPSSPPPQPQGLILWPSTFIPLSSSELEMHACKHVHALLGCKPALAEYVQSHTDEEGTRLVSDDEFEESIWQYECFRRERFNWRSNVPESGLDLDSPTEYIVISNSPSRSNTSKSSLDLSSPKKPVDSSEGPYPPDELTHVRTFRVYEAVKTTAYTTNCLLFPRAPPPVQQVVVTATFTQPADIILRSSGFFLKHVLVFSGSQPPTLLFSF
ncbi:hypothetical protein BD779DRAFT_68171 [Infundibulicybe gibba]|nr:hypothetical protein BD779DRAFT_68171 [Infundibulicybe gibba]